MDLTVGKLDRLVQIKLDFDISSNEVISLLEQEDWQVHPSQPLRSHLPFPKNEKLKDILQFVRSNYFVRKTMDKFHEMNPTGLQFTYAMTTDEFYLKSDVDCMFVRDQPSYISRIHLDPEKMIFTGIIYLSESDDPLVSTYFYTDDKKSNEFRSPTVYGTGWLQFNNRTSWHEGGNQGSGIRYILLFSYHFNVCVNEKRLQQ